MHNHDEHEHHHHHDNKVADVPADHMAVCPVTGDAIDTKEAEKLGQFRDYNGQRIYLCCATCVRLFDEHPEKYARTSHGVHDLTLTEKEHLVDNIWAFRFVSDQPLSWIPGQFIRVEIPHDNPDDEGIKRWFTISSTPDDRFIQITTRITSSTFKQALNKLFVNDSIKLLEMPDGDFIWQDDERPLVFIAGGIGITPFYSMLKARGHSGKPVSAQLIYNGRDDQLPFREELEWAAKQHSEFSVDYVIGERLTAEKIQELVPTLLSSQVYLSGPEPMVDSLGKDLIESGLPKRNIHQDFFPNYTDKNY